MKFKRFLIYTILFILAGFTTYIFIFINDTFTQINDLKTLEIKVTAKLCNNSPDCDKPTLEFVKKAENWVKLTDISKYAISAVIVSEDWAFPNHNGIDIDQIYLAVEKSLQKKKLVRGASTITQQVAKNLFLTSKKSFLRKFEEIIIAFKLEKTLGKKKILEIYFNIVEFGPKIYGIKKASTYYFGKQPSNLDIREGAFLAFLLPSPKKYHQSFKKRKLTKFANKITQSIYYKMNQAALITESELAGALSAGPLFELDYSSKEPVEVDGDFEDQEEINDSESNQNEETE